MFVLRSELGMGLGLQLGLELGLKLGLPLELGLALRLKLGLESGLESGLELGLLFFTWIRISIIVLFHTVNITFLDSLASLIPLKNYEK